MIIDFSVSNFLSIKDEQTLSLSATKSKEHSGNLITHSNGKDVSLVKSAVIYGANASGKSNIIKSIQQLFDTILFSHKIDIKQSIPSYKPYKLDKLCASKPIKFEIEFIANDKNIYRYLVELSRYEIEREELYFCPKGQESLLFSRIKGENIKFGNYLKGRKKTIEDELLPNQLFLTKAAYSRQEQLSNVFLFFLDNYHFIEKDEGSDLFSSHKTSKSICNENKKSFKEKVEIFLSAVDTGIKAVNVDINKANAEESLPKFANELSDAMKKRLMDEVSMKLTASHDLYEGEQKIGETHLDFKEESFGTRKLYALASYIIESLEEGTLLVIDELDNSLHPLISSLILSLFNNPKTNKKNAQLITASHDPSLLNPNLIRRDQIWFTEKKLNGATSLYSLVEFDKKEVRAQTSFSDWYLTGRFDAIPIIDNRIFEIFDDNCLPLGTE